MNRILEELIRELDGLPEDQQIRISRVLEEQLRSLKHEEFTTRGRWASVADRMAAANLMQGESEDFAADMRELRDNFSIGHTPGSK